MFTMMSADMRYNGAVAGAPALCRAFSFSGRDDGAPGRRLGLKRRARILTRRCCGNLPILISVCAAASIIAIAPEARGQVGGIALVANAQGQQVYINVSPATKRGSTTPRLPSSHPLIQRIVQKAAQRASVDPKLVDAMIQVESGYDPRAVSPKGAMGLMQLIPSTAQDFGVDNPFDPRQNIRGGVAFLRALLDRFSGNVPLSLAAYNAGPNRVAQDGGIPAIPETERYVRKVTRLYRASERREVGSPAALRRQSAAPIYTFVDSYGVVHFTNN